MLKNYLIVAIRNIRKHWGYSLINIIGLAIGMACCILVAAWVQDEFSFDRYHKNIDNLYRVNSVDVYPNGDRNYFGVTPGPLGPDLQENFPEVALTARLRRIGGISMQYEDRVFNEDKVGFADATLFQLFDYEFIAGNPAEPFTSPNAILLTATTAEKYFGERNPLGETLLLDNQHSYTVTGVLADIPHNSHIQFDFLIPFQQVENYGYSITSWGAIGFNTYVLLHDGASYRELDGKITDIFRRRLNPESIIIATLQPVKDIHFHSGEIGGSRHKGDLRYIYIFSLIGALLLVIACINFINLTTAKAAGRALEIGVRKVIGAGRGEIIRQFYAETILLASLAFCLAILLVELVLPVFNDLAGKQLSVSHMGGGVGILTAIGIVMLTGILAGSYPAIILSSFRPAAVLKGKISEGAGGSRFRHILVVSQFSIAIVLLILTFMAQRQLAFIRDKNLGFNSDHIVTMPIKPEMMDRYTTLKTELLANPRIDAVTVSSSLIMDVRWSHLFDDWEGKSTSGPVEIQVLLVDDDFCNTFEIPMASGRFFSTELGDSATHRVVLNQAAVAAINMDDPLGKRFDDDGTVIGVISDFHFESLRSTIQPLALFFQAHDRPRFMSLRIQSRDVEGTLGFIRHEWEKILPEYPFEYGFLDESIDDVYRSDSQVGIVFGYFSFLTMFISSLGLFGLASYIVERRRKEIGIRKVFGAPTAGIMYLISREFVILIGAANLIAWPLAYLATRRFLEMYAYRTDIYWYLFVLSGTLSLAIAMATIAWQVIRAAAANPIDVMKYE